MAAERQRQRATDHDEKLQHASMVAGRQGENQPGRVLTKSRLVSNEIALLPTAQGEVVTAARLLGPTSVALTGDQATETALKAQRLGDFDVFHFAVHAFADRKFPERAALVFLNIQRQET